MQDEISFGVWVRKQRRTLDLTRHAFANQVGCAEVTLRRIEAGTLKPSKQLAETLKEKKILEAKEHFLQKKSEYEQEVNRRNQKLTENETKLKQLQQSVNDKNAGLQKQINEYNQLKENLDKQLEVVNIKRTELERHQEEHIKRLEKVANLSAEEAKTELMEAVFECFSQIFVYREIYL